MIVNLFVGLSDICVLVFVCVCACMYVRMYVVMCVCVRKITYRYICRYLFFRQGYSQPCISYTRVGNLFVFLKLFPRALDEGAWIWAQGKDIH